MISGRITKQGMMWGALALAGGLAATPAAAVVPMGSPTAGLQAMRELNLIVLNDLQVNGGEVEGKAFVGRNVNGNSTQFGIGSSANGQGFAASARATLSVGGNVAPTLNINNGSNGSGPAKVGDFGGQNVFGVAIQGNVPGINFNGTGGTAHIGGNITNNFNIGAGTTVNLTGSALNGVNLSDNVTFRAGGSVGNINGGQNTTVVVRGNVANLGFGSGGKATIGGNLSQLSSGNNQIVSVAGSIAQGNVGANTRVTVGGAAANINGSSGAAVYAGGGISGNANGASFSPNFVWNGSISAPVVPPAPVAPDITGQAATLSADLTALSARLASLSIAGNPSSISFLNGNQTAIFNAVDNGAGYALFNISGSSFFATQQFAYNFGNTSLPVIINVSDIGNSTLNIASNFINNARANNQQVIWNFVDATSINIDRQFQGSILAPLANLAARVVEGSVVARNYTMNDEVHLGTYGRGDDFLSEPLDPAGAIPEPASWAMLIAGFGLVGAVMRRRAATAAPGRA